MAPDKKQWINRLFYEFDNLQRAANEYADRLEQLRKSVRQFIKSENIGVKEENPSLFPHPGFDPTSVYRQTNPHIPAALSAVINLLDQELAIQKKEYSAHTVFMDKFWKQLTMAFDSAKTCDSCGRLISIDQLHHLPPPQDNIFICEECFENDFFECHKCKRVLSESEIREEDSDTGYGYFCKDCIKPMGFPQEVLVAPDFEGCEEIAGADLEALSDYSLRVTGWMEPEMRDAIKLKFVRQLSDYYALYESEKGVKYEIGRLDWKGLGSMRELEEDQDI